MHDIAISRLDGIPADDKKLHQLTGYTLEEFRMMLARFALIVMRDKKRPIFRDDWTRLHDQGNRCKLQMSHLLLMVLMRAGTGPCRAAWKEICIPVFDDYGINDVLHLVVGIVNSHEDWKEGTDIWDLRG